jgi:hypothetical protein
MVANRKTRRLHWQGNKANGRKINIRGCTGRGRGVPKCSEIKKKVYTIFCTRPTTCEFWADMRGHVRMSKNAMRADPSRQMKKNKSASTHPAYRQSWDTLLESNLNPFFRRLADCFFVTHSRLGLRTIEVVANCCFFLADLSYVGFVLVGDVLDKHVDIGSVDLFRVHHIAVSVFS